MNEWDAYDCLLPDVKKVLQEAPMAIDARDILRLPAVVEARKNMPLVEFCDWLKEQISQTYRAKNPLQAR